MEAPPASIPANSSVETHFETLDHTNGARSTPLTVRPFWGHFGVILGPQKHLKTSLEAKITTENAFSDLGAHTNVVRNALLLPLALVWSRLVDIDF